MFLFFVNNLVITVKMSVMFITVTLITLLCLGVSYVVSNFWRRLSLIKRIKTLSGPKAFPLIGSALYILRILNPTEIIHIFDTLVNDFPSPFQVWFGNFAYIGIYDGDHMKSVLQSRCLEKSSIYNIFKPVLNTGLITSPVSLWSLHRKMIEKMFTPNNLRLYSNIFVEQSLEFMDELEKIERNGNEIILLDFLYKRLLNIASEIMMDIKLESQIINRMFEAAMSIKEMWKYRLSNIFLHPNVIFNFSTTKWKQQKQLNCINLVLNEIRQRKHVFNTPEATKSNNKNTLFDILMEAWQEGRMTVQETQDHMITMLFAAADTTAGTINFVLFMLANFPEVQEKTYKELSEIYGTESAKSVRINYDDLQKMDYLTRVIKETLRLFPGAPFIGRILTEDLKIGETILPKGADTIMFILHMHRNKKHWSNPLMFDPDRFLPEKEAHCSRHFMPFGSGLRNCIGQKYAMISMKIILATLIRTFEFEVDKYTKIDEIKLNTDIALCTVEPLKIKIKKRDY